MLSGSSIEGLACNILGDIFEQMEILIKMVIFVQYWFDYKLNDDSRM